MSHFVDRFICQQSICMFVFYILDFIAWKWQDQRERENAQVSNKKYFSLKVFHFIDFHLFTSFYFKNLYRTHIHLLSNAYANDLILYQYSLNKVIFSSAFVFSRVLSVRCTKRVHLVFEFLTWNNVFVWIFLVYLHRMWIRTAKLNASKIDPNGTKFTPLDACAQHTLLRKFENHKNTHTHTR